MVVVNSSTLMMEVCASPTISPAAASSFLCGVLTEKAREYCSPIASAVICNVFYAVFAFYLAVVGSTLGAMTGAVIGLKTESGFFHGVVVGAFAGTILSHEVVKASLGFWHSDDSELGSLLHLMEIFMRLLDGRLLGHQYSLARPGPVPSQFASNWHDIVEQTATVETTPEVPRFFTTVVSGRSVDKVPKIRITNRNIYDSSGNRTTCSVCLQDFELGDVAGSLPQCHHLFHLPCITKWLIRQSSCPLCRRNL